MDTFVVDVACRRGCLDVAFVQNSSRSFYHFHPPPLGRYLAPVSSLQPLSLSCSAGKTHYTDKGGGIICIYNVYRLNKIGHTSGASSARSHDMKVLYRCLLRKWEVSVSNYCCQWSEMVHSHLLSFDCCSMHYFRLPYISSACRTLHEAHFAFTPQPHPSTGYYRYKEYWRRIPRTEK